MENEMKPISARMFEELDRIGVTSYQVSKVTGISPTAFTKYRKGEMQPTRKVIDKIHQCYPDINVIYIEYGNTVDTSVKVARVVEEKKQDTPDSILTEQIRNMQKTIENLQEENKMLLRMLSERK